MQYLAIATDGDGTLMRGGRMGRETVRALRRWRAAGGKLLLATGERPQDLCEFPHIELFDRVVAENGAVLVACNTHKERRLLGPPPARLIKALKRAGVDPLKVGRATIETESSQEDAVMRVLSELKLDWGIARNRKDEMIVHRSVTKTTGLAVALKELGISPRQVVAIGDGENDIPLLAFCGLPVAVGNAVSAVKSRARLVTVGQYGKGVVEVIDRLLSAGNGSARRGRGRCVASS